MKQLLNYIIENSVSIREDLSLSDLTPQNLFKRFPQEETETDEAYKLRLATYLATKKEDVEKINQKLKEKWIDLPYKTVIYNKGTKNRNWWITRKNMNNWLDRAEHDGYTCKEVGSWEDTDKKWEITVRPTVHKHYKGIIMDLAPDDICFVDGFSMKNIEKITDNFTKAPEVERYIYVEPFWGDTKYESRQINKILDSYSKYFKSGKLEVTLSEAPEGMDKDWLYMRVTDTQFIKDVEEEIKRMTDLDRLKAKKIKIDKEAAEAVARAKKEREERAAAAAQAEAARKKREEEEREEMNRFLDDMRKNGATEEEIEQAREEWNIGRWLDQHGNPD
jgi:hypothetical protein